MATIFVSYRRRDSAPLVGRICDRLKAYYGPGNVFLDIDDIPYGDDFRDRVRETLARTDIVLAVIGSDWCGTRKHGSRLDDVDDPVRVEVECALAAGTRIVPALIGGASMPAEQQVPDALRRLLYLNAVPISVGVDFHRDIDRAIDVLDTLLGPKAPLAARNARSPLRLLVQPKAWFVVVIVAVPFLATALGMAPPWPRGIEISTAAFAAAVIASCLLYLPRLDRRSTGRLVSASIVSLAIFGCAYFAGDAAFVYRTPSGGVFAKGFVCTSDARLLYSQQCPFLGLDQLKGAEYESERLWTTQSIAVVQMVLDLFWLLAFAGASVLAAYAVIRLQQERRIRSYDPTPA